jgi:hypothetical protein
MYVSLTCRRRGLQQWNLYSTEDLIQVDEEEEDPRYQRSIEDGEE